MTGLQMLYAIINFLILFGALYFLVGKSIKKSVSSHREKILADIDHADEAREYAENLASEIEKQMCSSEKQQAGIIQRAKVQAQSNSFAAAELGKAEAETIIKDAKNNENILRREMNNRIRAEAIKKVTDLAKEEFKQDGFAQSRQIITDAFLEQIVDLVAAMPSDILSMSELKKLNITVSSPEPLSDEEMNRLKQILCKTFISCKNEVDDRVIGGVHMRVGDTVYDGTLENSLNRLNREVENNMISCNNQMQSVV